MLFSQVLNNVQDVLCSQGVLGHLAHGHLAQIFSLVPFIRDSWFFFHYTDFYFYHGGLQAKAMFKDTHIFLPRPINEWILSFTGYSLRWSVLHQMPSPTAFCRLGLVHRHLSKNDATNQEVHRDGWKAFENRISMWWGSGRLQLGCLEKSKQSKRQSSCFIWIFSDWSRRLKNAGLWCFDKCRCVASETFYHVGRRRSSNLERMVFFGPSY